MYVDIMWKRGSSFISHIRTKTIVKHILIKIICKVRVTFWYIEIKYYANIKLHICTWRRNANDKL